MGRTQRAVVGSTTVREANAMVAPSSHWVPEPKKSVAYGSQSERRSQHTRIWLRPASNDKRYVNAGTLADPLPHLSFVSRNQGAPRQVDAPSSHDGSGNNSSQTSPHISPRSRHIPLIPETLERYAKSEADAAHQSEFERRKQLIMARNGMAARNLSLGRLTQHIGSIAGPDNLSSKEDLGRAIAMEQRRMLDELAAYVKVGPA